MFSKRYTKQTFTNIFSPLFCSINLVVVGDTHTEYLFFGIIILIKIDNVYKSSNIMNIHNLVER